MFISFYLQKVLANAAGQVHTAKLREFEPVRKRIVAWHTVLALYLVYGLSMVMAKLPKFQGRLY
jgi:uncharacterized membrane protein